MKVSSKPSELGAVSVSPPILGMGVPEMLPLPCRARGSLCFHKDAEIGEEGGEGGIKHTGEHGKKTMGWGEEKKKTKPKGR